MKNVPLQFHNPLVLQSNDFLGLNHTTLGMY